jgi:hypothetical protein
MRQAKGVPGRAGRSFFSGATRGREVRCKSRVATSCQRSACRRSKEERRAIGDWTESLMLDLLF